MSVRVNNVNSVSEALEDVSKAIDTLSTYVEEIHWNGRHTLIGLLEDLYVEQVEPYIEKEDT
tara:strand:- start:73 stop:258 length:186 start_codon:yes stop_codon:yes gene_type:complete